MLARREHSRQELANKLQQRQVEPSLIVTVLDHLTARDYLNETRFVEAYIRSRFSKGLGPLRIRQELKQRGIADALMEAGIVALSDLNWRELAERVRQKKFGQRQPVTYQERMKQRHFLYYRGFDMSNENENE